MPVHKTPIRAYGGDPWTIVEEGFDPARQRVSESVFSLANEFMGVRGYFEEGYSGDHLLGSYFNHLYELVDIRHDQYFKGFITQGAAMPNAIDWLYTRIAVDGEQLDLATSSFSGFTRRLDMRRGVLTRDLVWETRSGKHVRVSFSRFTSMDATCVGGQRVTLEALDFTGMVSVRAGLDANTIYEIGAGWDQTGGAKLDAGAPGAIWQCGRQAELDGGWAIQAATRRSGHQLFSSAVLRADGAAERRYVEEDGFVGSDLKVVLEAGRPSVIDRIVVNHWARTDDADAVWQRGLGLFREHTRASFDDLLADHVAAWRRVWQTLDIEIDGDPELLQGLRFSSFQTYQTYHGEDAGRNALCKGLTGEVYFGWVYWDSEVYTHRLMLFVNPSAARQLLQYRYNRLGEALERARELGCEGARFPFATITGREDSGTWQHVDLEIHASLAVAFAIWHHEVVLQDKAFLYREGAEMLVQICRYLASAGGWSPSRGDFGFYGVMGPDEFHMMVNHNAYTNVLGKRTFEFTLAVLDELRDAAPDRHRELVERTKLRPDEPSRWAEMARNMRIPRDEATGVLEQHAGYFDLPHVDLEQVARNEIPIYRHWPYVKIFRFDMIKQPDVLNLMAFFSSDYTLEEKRANYEFYEPRTIHESSLSPSLHAILAAELGKLDEAYGFLTLAARLDLDDYNRNTDQGLHVTAASGAWAGVVCGFGGLRSDRPVLSLAPTLPGQWRSYRFRLRYRAALLEVRVDDAVVALRVLEGDPVTVLVYGVERGVDGEGIVLARGGAEEASQQRGREGSGVAG